MINDQVGSKNKPAPVGHTRRVKPVHDIGARMKKDRSEIERINKNGNKRCLDTQSKLESNMPDDGTIMAVKTC